MWKYSTQNDSSALIPSTNLCFLAFLLGTKILFTDDNIENELTMFFANDIDDSGLLFDLAMSISVDVNTRRMNMVNMELKKIIK